MLHQAGYRSFAGQVLQYVTICHNMSQYVTICHNMSQSKMVKDGQRWSKGGLSGSEETGRLTITSRKVVGIGPQRSLDLAGREIGMWMQRGDSIILIEPYPTMSIRYVQTTEFTPAMSMAATKNKAKTLPFHTWTKITKGQARKNVLKSNDAIWYMFIFQLFPEYCIMYLYCYTLYTM